MVKRVRARLNRPALELRVWIPSRRFNKWIPHSGGSMPQMYGKWRVVEELGKGGQGTVYLAYDTKKFNLEAKKQMIVRDIGLAAFPENVADNTPAKKATKLQAAEMLATTILEFGKVNGPGNCGALKVIHPFENSDEYEKQLARMNGELEGLHAMTHPAIVKVLDENLKGRWFVTEYFPSGALSKHRERYRGDLIGALKALRPVIEGVAEMHSKKLVHRDIKPDNVFVSGSGSLVLGDLGLVCFADDDRSRVSSTYSNVGSRDWMPGWAMGLRLEDVSPSFDVFSLGKLLWSMVSGQPKLQLWYHHQKRFELEEMFPKDPAIRWARKILDPCIVEHEDQCLASAGKLLELVDTVLRALSPGAQVIGEGVERFCRVCGLGRYQVVADEIDAIGNFGLDPTGSTRFKVFSCTHCGHAELFHFPADSDDRDQ